MPSRYYINDEGLITEFADLIDGADVGMVQCGGGTRLPAEAFQRLRVLGNFVGQEFEDHEAAEHGVLGVVDHAHAAAELLDDAIVGDGLADHDQRRPALPC